MRTIAVTCQKGGTGKTTTALAIAHGLADKGKKVLFVDMDAQGDGSYSIGVFGGTPSMADVLDGGSRIASAALSSGTIHAVPSSSRLSIIDAAGIGALKDALSDVSSFYDVSVIDSPPQLGYLMAASLAAADFAVVTCECDSYSLAAIDSLSDTIEAVKESHNKALSVAGVLLTKYNPRTVMARELEDSFKEAAAMIGTSLFDTRIRSAQAVKDAAALKKSIYAYAPKAGVTADYRSFVDELERRAEI